VQKQLIAGQQSLYEAQKGMCLVLVQTMQSTGNIDMSKLTDAMHDALHHKHRWGNFKKKTANVEHAGSDSCRKQKSASDKIAMYTKQLSDPKLSAADKDKHVPVFSKRTEYDSDLYVGYRNK